ncbi:MAG: FAD/NAD(P)-binding protein, partial [Planctomycetaceae bacterium]
MIVEPVPAPKSPVLAIVGSGFSGTLVAVNLVRLAEGRPLRVVLFEKRERFARGAAYSTTCPQHLLNVPAGMMSALVDEPDHFLSWLQARDPEAHRGTFAPRQVYGAYLEGLLRDAANTPGATIELVRDEVVDLVAEGPGPGVRLIGRNGSRLRADQVVLALGNPTPQDPIPGPSRAQGLENYLSIPWEDGALDGLDEEDSVLLIGSGLTAVDLIVEARAKGHKGPMIVVSRHGLLPFPHAQVPPLPHGLAADGAARTVRSLLRHVRQEASRYASEGGDWRAIIDSLRPVTQTIWHSFDEGEKARFVRHLSSRWDVHRHRIAPEVARIVDEARRDGQLTVIAGRVLALDERGDRVAVTLR